MLEILPFVVSNPVTLVYATLASLYGMISAIYQHQHHGGLCACYSISAVLHLILGAYYFYY